MSKAFRKNLGTCITTRSDEDTETEICRETSARRWISCITTRSDEDTETAIPDPDGPHPTACITTRSDEDTETVEGILEADVTLVASPPDPMRILKLWPLFKALVQFMACITTRSDEDTETHDAHPAAHARLGLHHHPIR